MATEREFHQACVAMIRECKSLGYTPTRFTSMINTQGAVAAVRSLLRSGEVQSGLERLVALGRVDLAVESLAQQPQWHDLFTDEDRELAAWRLANARAT